MVLWFALACSEYELERPIDGWDLGDDSGGGADGTFQESEDLIVDTFEVADNTDILFFGDTSSSMEPELVTMNTHVEAFVDRLASFQTDWQLLAITGPSGCSTNGWSNASTPDWQARFAEDLLTPPGADLVDEWGLNNVQVAVEMSVSGGCNEGFMRPDALLHVIFISDEDDNSPGWEWTDDYWQPYVAGVQAARGDASNVRFSAIGGPVPGGCEGAEPARGYWEAVSATEGSFISICEDWGNQIEELANTSVTRSSFALSSTPVASTVQVAVAGELRDSGWTWREADNTLVFDNSAPIAGQIVEIAYEPRP